MRKQRQAAFSIASDPATPKIQSPRFRPFLGQSSVRPPTTAFSSPARSELSLLPKHCASFLLADDAMATFADVTTATKTSFEPVVDVPALLSSFVILVGALLLRLRVGSIGKAAERRMGALETLRDIKAKQLSNEVSPEQVQLAVIAYQDALDEEEKLRTLLPGVRLRAPNNPQKSELDQRAVRQYLGANATTFVNENIEQGEQSFSQTAQEQVPFSNNIAPIFGLGALLVLILSPQFLTIFISESDKIEILDILSGDKLDWE